MLGEMQAWSSLTKPDKKQGCNLAGTLLPYLIAHFSGSLTSGSLSQYPIKLALFPPLSCCVSEIRSYCRYAQSYMCLMIRASRLKFAA